MLIPLDNPEVVKAPLPYPGCKARGAKHIIEAMPYTSRYIEVFGGSAAVLLARHKVDYEVYNDRNSGITAFFRCMRTETDCDKLAEILLNTIYSREEFLWSRDSWEDCTNYIERAARWYYSMCYSYQTIGRAFGRDLQRASPTIKFRKRIAYFPAIRERFEDVLVENRDWRDVLETFDQPNTVFYLDPPYMPTDVFSATYRDEMTVEDHQEMLDTVFELDSFVAVSGYDNATYHSYPWDEVVEYEVFSPMATAVFNEGNNQQAKQFTSKRENVKECLYIKESG